MQRRAFIRLGCLTAITASQSAFTRLLIAAAATPQTYRYHITPFRGRITETEHTVEQDDDWAKQELMSEAGAIIKLRESVEFENFFRKVLNWRPAASLLMLRDQINALASKRSTADDGFVGDASHAKRTSDHNPWIQDGQAYVVSAFDVTHDPNGGCDAGHIAESLAQSKDKRTKYLIWKGRIANSEKIGSSPAWTWRQYNGPNRHEHHIHISVLPVKSLYDDVSAWKLSVA
jgi:hypothetical protein